MKSTAKRILTALWIVGAFAGLLAVIALPGRWDRGGPAEAHVTAGVDIIDTAAKCDLHELNAGGGANCAAMTPNVWADAFPFADLNGDTVVDAGEEGFLIDTDGDTIVDAIVAPSGTVITLVAHVHTGAADVANGTAVTFTATGSNAFFRSWSRETGGGLDTNDNDAVNITVDGSLFDGADAQTIEAETVSDLDDTTSAGQCDEAADTCIDSDKAANPDGIAIAQVSSGVPTQSTITVQSTVGTDTVTVIWTGAATTVTVTATNAAKTVAQTIIAQAGIALAGVNKGDPDLTITAEIRDSAGNLVPADANVDCAILTASEQARADVVAVAVDDGAITAGPNLQADLPDVRPGVKQISLESDLGNTRGDVTVTCWSNTVNADDTLDTNEPFGTVTINVAGPPATVVLTGNATMPVGSQALKAVVTDGDGNPVANATNCTWLLIDPQLIAGLASPVSGGTAGTVANSATNTLVAAANGAVSVSVTCGIANDLLAVTIGGVAFPPGDVDCDGNFTVADLLAAARALVGLDQDLVAC